MTIEPSFHTYSIELTVCMIHTILCIAYKILPPRVALFFLFKIRHLSHHAERKRRITRTKKKIHHQTTIQFDTVEEAYKRQSPPRS
jgi:hypothetical protein